MNKNVMLVLGVAIVLILGYFMMNGSANEESSDSDDAMTNSESSQEEVMENDSAEKTESMDTENAGDAMENNTVVVDMTGKNFAFSQETITVKKGDTVKINFESTDGFHDWVVDEFDAATEQVQTGGTTSVEFVADKAGEFEYYCSVGQHRANGMVGKLIVE